MISVEILSKNELSISSWVRFNPFVIVMFHSLFPEILLNQNNSYLLEQCSIIAGPKNLQY